MLPQTNVRWPEFAESARHMPLDTPIDGEGEYTHILVPTTLSPGERSAILLGFQLTVTTGAGLTLLHVVPDVEPATNGDEHTGSLHWLEAIDNLHQAMRTGPQLQPHDRLKLLEQLRGRLSEFVEEQVPAFLRLQANVRFECLAGDAIEEIARFAVAESADLVILTSRLSRWNLPVVPSRLHRVLQRLHSRVIVVRPDAKPRKAADKVAAENGKAARAIR